MDESGSVLCQWRAVVSTAIEVNILIRYCWLFGYATKCSKYFVYSVEMWRGSILGIYFHGLTIAIRTEEILVSRSCTSLIVLSDVSL